MKRLLYIMGIFAVVLVSNCSEIPENNDPILGVWVKTELQQDASKNTNSNVKEEWTFNDVYLGRYERFKNGSLEYSTDFSWEVDNGVYSLKYEVDQLNPLQLTMDLPELLLQNGETFATKQ
ncbi:lipocalin family protein [Flavobacterium sp. ASW18X]|uniref:lipocalin family protein n=1 Tax=Flavobacterium sp. ASW18X TaxID=2572595 RepID=UPI0010ADD3F5|nr:lipocalin family protein [Flavobacterium sp. ASW18X]TKD61793.1 hypothetical protein FBT53_10445 [Flavobacterium sp. ASW18X]